MTKTKTTAAATEANLREIVTSTPATDRPTVIVIEWGYWKDLLIRNEISVGEHHLVQFNTKKDWNELASLIDYQRTTRTIPGNRDEKPGHAKTLRDKDIPTIASYDHRRGYLAINTDSFHCINHGHRFRRLDDMIQSNNGNEIELTLNIVLTTAKADGFDGTQANWTIADGALPQLKEDGYQTDEAKYLSRFMEQGSSLLLTRLQNLAPKGGQQSGSTYQGRALNKNQQGELWNYCPIHLILWNMLSVRTKTGRTMADIVLNAKDLIGKEATTQKLRADLALIALLDTIPTASDPKTLEKLLNRFEDNILQIDKALKPVYTMTAFSNINERYRFIVALWKTLETGHAPTFETITEATSDDYPNGLQTLKADNLDKMKTALKKSTEKKD